MPEYDTEILNKLTEAGCGTWMNDPDENKFVGATETTRRIYDTARWTLLGKRTIRDVLENDGPDAKARIIDSLDAFIDGDPI